MLRARCSSLYRSTLRLPAALCARLETDYPFIHPFNSASEALCLEDTNANGRQCTCWRSVSNNGAALFASREIPRWSSARNSRPGVITALRAFPSPKRMSASAERKREQRTKSWPTCCATFSGSARCSARPAERRRRPIWRVPGQAGQRLGAAARWRPRTRSNENRKSNGLSEKKMLYLECKLVYLLSQLGCSTTRTGWLDSLL